MCHIGTILWVIAFVCFIVVAILAGRESGRAEIAGWVMLGVANVFVFVGFMCFLFGIGSLVGETNSAKPINACATATYSYEQGCAYENIENYEQKMDKLGNVLEISFDCNGQKFRFENPEVESRDTDGKITKVTIVKVYKQNPIDFSQYQANKIIIE